MPRVHTSRRVGGLKPTDFDHEIALVDHDGATDRGTVTPREGGDMERITTESQLLPNAQQPGQRSPQRPEAEGSTDGHIQERPSGELQHEEELPHEALRPSIEIQGT